ncbi:MAG TPA: hypothetical protein VFD43_13015 [Planctomycetota bacterium]|nr:hypothetical protein [Planctomycetota bacterium]
MLIREIRVALPDDAGSMTADRFPRDELELRSAGDFDGDGRDDLLVMMRQCDHRWWRLCEIDVRSGSSGASLFRWPSSTRRDHERVIDAAAAGDVDDDGRADLLVSADLGSGESVVRLIGGGTGEVLREHGFSPDGAKGGVRFQRGAAWGEYAGFGAVVGPAGDVDRDGTPDYFVAAPGADGRPRNGGRPTLLGSTGWCGLGSGLIDVHSGRTGSRLWSQAGIADENGFAGAAASIGDVNGDGVPELAVGAAASLGLLVHDFCQGGEVFILSGRDGEVLGMRPGRTNMDGLGRPILPLGDVDGDGRPDLAVGAMSGMLPAPLDTLVLRSSDLQVLRTIDSSLLGARCPTSVRTAGDIDGDGHLDLVAFAGLEHRRWGDCDREVHVVSPVGRRSLFTVEPEDDDPLFGCAAGPAGDVDGDGRDDLAICLGRRDEDGRPTLRIGVFGRSAQ